MVLPGIQALLGFQLIACFSDVFFRQLNDDQRTLHLGAVALTSIAVGLTLTPAAIHRRSEPDQVSETLIKVSGSLLAWSLLPLLLAISIDFYIVSLLALGRSETSLVLAIGIFLFLASMWLLWPWMRRRPQPSEESGVSEVGSRAA